MSPRALDHVVVPCRDLAGAGARLTALGFTVGRENRHPWGTVNRIVQFPGSFIELLSFAPDALPLRPEDDAFPFAGFMAGQGLGRRPSGMVVMRSEDAEADARAFAADGIGRGRMLRFSREGRAPDGSTRRVAFDLAFAEAAAMPEIGWFVCRQRVPENFWDPAAQRHPNGATGIAAVAIEAEDPEAGVPFLSRWTGSQPIRTGQGIAFDLAEGSRITLAPVPGIGSGRLASLAIAGVSDLRLGLAAFDPPA